MSRYSILRFAVILGLLATTAPPARRVAAATALELYGTFHALGVVVSLTAGEDANQNATASLSYRRHSQPVLPGQRERRLSDRVPSDARQRHAVCRQPVLADTGHGVRRHGDVFGS